MNHRTVFGSWPWRAEEERTRMTKATRRSAHIVQAPSEDQKVAMPLAPRSKLPHQPEKEKKPWQSNRPSALTPNEVRHLSVARTRAKVVEGRRPSFERREKARGGRPAPFPQWRLLCACIILIGSCFHSLACKASEVSRIQSINFDMSKVQTMWVSPGLASVIHFPCDIEEAFVGRTEDLKVQISPTSKKVITLYLNKSAASPTNLLVKCEASENLFVFDVFPSQSRHQDFLRVRKGYNEPEMRIELTQAEARREKSDRAITNLLKRGRYARSENPSSNDEAKLPAKGLRNEK